MARALRTVSLARLPSRQYGGLSLQSCSQCSFTAQFESALIMHKELHHDSSNPTRLRASTGSPKLMTIKDIDSKIPRDSSLVSPFTMRKNNLKLTRTSSATKLFGKLKARICKSKTLFAHPEETDDSILNLHNLSAQSDCSSKALKVDSLVLSPLTTCYEDPRIESYGCHMCSFVADRITVLDRHLLNDHKIGLENLLKLVMAKTKDGLSEDTDPILGIRQPYYKPLDEIIEEGEFIIETVAPKIKILKHTATNTDLTLIDNSKVKDVENNWKVISDEIDNMMKFTKNGQNDDVMNKMKVLNDYMCRFVTSTNTLKKVLDSKVNVRSPEGFHLGLGDRDTPREWEKAHSEKMERRTKYPDNTRSDKIKMSSESFYF